MKALSLQKCRFVFENKNTSHLSEWMVEFSPELWQEIEARFASVLRSSPQNLPDREYASEPEREWVRGIKNLIGISNGPDGTELDSQGKAILERKQNGYWRATGRAILGFPCSYCPMKRPCWGEDIEETVIEDKPIWYVKSARKEVG